MKPSQNKSTNLDRKEIANELSTAKDWKELAIKAREKKGEASPKERVFQPASKRFERAAGASLKKKKF